MQPYTIIWDFDGTLLPMEPYDSEQSLLIHVVNQSDLTIPLHKHLVGRIIVFADRMEWIGDSFKRFYLWVLKGTPKKALHHVATRLAKNISHGDCETIRRLKNAGHRMMVISCGTLDLSERILKKAGIYYCFETIAGNSFRFENDCITGMDMDILRPEDKLRVAQSMGLAAEHTVVIGDGYTDLPLLEWAGISVMMDRTGKKRKQYAQRNYHFIASLPEIFNVIKGIATRQCD